MNAPIARLFVVVVVLFAVLVGFTSGGRCSTPTRSATTRKNRRELLEEQQIRRGVIRADDGTLLARSLTQRRRHLRAHATRRARCSRTRSATRYVRHGPRRPGALLQRRAHRAQRATSTRSSTACRASSQEGDDLRTSLDPAAQRVALQQLGGRKGAVVALDPRTGAIKVMASVPGYDPNTVKHQSAVHGAQPRQRRAAVEPQHAGRLSAGLDVQGRHRDRGDRLGALTPRLADQRAQRQGHLRRSPHNDGGEAFGHITLTDALTKSVNTAFGDVGEKLGKATMKKYMDRLGFGGPVAVVVAWRRGGVLACPLQRGHPGNMME